MGTPQIFCLVVGEQLLTNQVDAIVADTRPADSLVHLGRGRFTSLAQGLFLPGLNPVQPAGALQLRQELFVAWRIKNLYRVNGGSILYAGSHIEEISHVRLPALVIVIGAS